MKIVIGHLYYDLMNLYGDSGNLNVIKYQLEKQDIDLEIKKLSIDDKLDLNNLDMIYIGSSTENNRDICLEHLIKYKKEIKKFIEDKKFILVTGNSLSLFGKTLDNKDTLNIFDFNTKTGKRVVNEVITKCNFCNKDIYGFLNHSDYPTYNKVNHLFTNEGIIYNNFYGTYMIGPLLIRNYEFTEEFIKRLILSKDKEFKFKDFDFSLEKLAYEEYIEFKKNKIHIK